MQQPPELAYRLDLNRRRIYYLEQGRGDTVLLLHGNGANAALYAPLIAGLAPHYRVLAPDLPGYGRSAALYPLSLESYLRDLEAFIQDHAGPGPLLLIGHSLGGLLAYLLQLRGKLPRLARAVWMEAALFNIDWRLQLILPGYGILHSVKPHNRGAIESLMRKLCWDFDRGNAVSREAFISNYLRSDSAVQGMFFTSAPALLPYRFAAIREPVLCIRGEKESFVTRATDWFAPQLPDARKVVLSRTGHFMIDENNEELNRTILDFLRQPQLAQTA
ncbi:MAG: alpha/beta fold hydrolase [Candidatus Sericytochromatia bacterium]